MPATIPRIAGTARSYNSQEADHARHQDLRHYSVTTNRSFPA